MKRAYADTPWGQIHYRFDGEGDALLLLHQTALSSLMFEKAIPILAQRYRVIAPDTLGYGESDKPTREMEIPDYAECVGNFLNELGIQKADVVAHYTGGGIAVELAVSHPERVTKLVINGVPYMDARERERMLRTETSPVPPKDDGSHLTYWWERAKRKSPGVGPELWHRFVLQNLRAGEYYSSAYRAIFRYDLGSRLPLLRCPVLVMCGDQDMFYEASKAAVALIPGAKQVIVPGTGGAIIDQKTEEYAKTILDFLATPGA